MYMYAQSCTRTYGCVNIIDKVKHAYLQLVYTYICYTDDRYQYSRVNYIYTYSYY